MSRIGRMPIVIPQGVNVTVEGNLVSVKGPKGTLTRALHPEMKITLEDGALHVSRPSDAPKHRALHGLTRALLNNMVVGVTKGFEKNLNIVGVGYRASKQGRTLVLNMGYSHPVEITPEEGVEVEVPAQARMIVKGIDKEKVGALAAEIRKVREPEPYLGKGIMYEGEVIRRKVGKTGK
ncbi:MAG: 50S ribosomal protein L6 [Negativicutes bacterium]|nr:50S ribosomal protein L6 [Negativicutes bacterium]